MNPKKIYLIIFSGISFTTLYSIDDDTFLDEMDHPTHIQAHVEQEHMSLSDGGCCFPLPPISATEEKMNDFLSLLVSKGIPSILAQNFFLGTNPVQSRSLLDLPSTGLDLTINDDNCRQFSLNFFYNQTSKMKYRCNSACIGSYIDITNPDILADLDEDLLNAFGISSDDVLDLLLRANPFSLQERRAGFMINYNHRIRRGVFGLNVPLYYFERNFFLSEAEQEVIAAAPIFQKFGPLTSDADALNAYGLKNLASDQIGFGDLRLNGYYIFKDSEKHYGTIGGVLTIPTAFAITKHVFCGKYCKTAPRPLFNLVELAGYDFPPTGEQLEAIQNTLYQYSTCVLHQLTANLCYTSLGNYHHVTIGPRFEYDYKIRPYWGVKIYSDIQYFCPAHEKRFYIPIKNPADFTDAVRDYDNAALAEENLLFLSQQITDFLFPKCIDTKVSPGFLVNLSAATWFKTKRTNIEFGYNFWRQSTEKIHLACKQDRPYYVNRGVKSGAYENKFYARFLVKMPEHCGGLHVGFYGDYTFQSYNIGKDFTAAVNFELYY